MPNINMRASSVLDAYVAGGILALITKKIDPLSDESLRADRGGLMPTGLASRSSRIQPNGWAS